jgi:hypothetical protein
MPKQIRSCDFGQIGRHILLDLRAHSRVEFRNQLLIDFFTDRDQAGLNFPAQGELIDSLCEPPNSAFSLLEFNVVTFAIGHGMAEVPVAESAREPSGKVGDLIHETVVSIGKVKLCNWSQSRGAVKRGILEFIRLESCEIGYNQQCALHKSFPLDAREGGFLFII